MNRTSEGSVALLTVILLLVVLVSVGAAIVASSTDYLISGKNVTERYHLEMLNRTCVEEAMYRIKRNPSFTGDFSITVNDRTCVVTAQTINASTRSLRIVNESGNYTLTKEYSVDTSTNPNTISEL